MVSGSGTLEGVHGGRADAAGMSDIRAHLGRSKLYAVFVRIDDPGAGPPTFTWQGVTLGTVRSTGQGTVEGFALALSSTCPIGPDLLEWSVTDAGP